MKIDTDVFARYTLHIYLFFLFPYDFKILCKHTAGKLACAADEYVGMTWSGVHPENVVALNCTFFLFHQSIEYCNFLEVEIHVQIGHFQIEDLV